MSSIYVHFLSITNMVPVIHVMYVLSAGGYVGFIFRLVVSPLQELSQYEKAPKGVTVRNLFPGIR